MNATTKTQLARWGDSLAVRIPLRVVETDRLREGDELTLAVGKNGAIVIRPAQRKYQLNELISKITARNCHKRDRMGFASAEKAGNPQLHPGRR